MTLPLPTANQPIDYDFINTLINEVNKISQDVSSLNQSSKSSIKGNQIRQSDMVFFGVEVQIPKPAQNVKYSEVRIPFDGVSFRDAPIVTSTAKTAAKTLNFTISVESVSSKACNLNIIWAASPPEGTITISVLAAGQRAI
jgi:hypothetical protein